MRETCYRGRLLRDEQRSPDLAVRPALREDGQHLDLAGAQAKTREFVLCRVRCRSRRRVGLLPLHWLVERGASPGSQGTDQLDQRLRAYPGGGVMGTAQRRGSFRSDGDTNGTRGLSEQGLRQPEAKMYRPHSIPPASATSTTARQAARSGRSCIRDISEAPSARAYRHHAVGRNPCAWPRAAPCCVSCSRGIKANRANSGRPSIA
jgi:hypothetical protein